MQKTDNLISDALIALKKITISEIGSLTLIDQQYSINEDLKTIFPKKKIVVFNQFLTTSDGRLEKYLQETLSISPDEVKALIKDFVSNIYNTLKTQDRYLITNFGEFHKTITGSIDFKLSEISKINEDSFGLGPIALNPLSKETTHLFENEVEETLNPNIQNQKNKETIDNELSIKKTEETTVNIETHNSTQTPEKSEPTNQPIIESNLNENIPTHIEETPQTQTKKKTSWFRISFISAVLIAVAAWIFLNQNMIHDFLNKKNETQKDTLAVNSEIKDTNSTTIENQPIDSVTKTETSSKEIQNQSKKTESNTTEASTLSTSKLEEGKLYIITGSFGSISNAERQVKKLKEMGYPSEILKYGTKFLVCANSFTSQVEAEESNKKLQDTEFAGSWILKR